MIKSKTIKSKEQKIFTVEFMGMSEDFDSESRAEAQLKEWQEKYKSRIKDFLIAEKLLGYIWVTHMSHNYLIAPHAIPTAIDEDDFGKKYPDDKTSGILWHSMTDENWHPPDFIKSENFLTLVGALASDGVYPSFGGDYQCGVCSIKNYDNNILSRSRVDKKEDYWHIDYCLKLALKEAAFKYCKNYKK